MVAQEWIAILSVVVLIGLVVVLIYLIVILHRANAMLTKMSHFTDIFRNFVSDIVPAIVNVGTIATAVETVVRRLHALQEERENRAKKAKKS